MGKSSLQSVNFAGNNIQSIPKTAMDIRSLKEVWLGVNPYHCDCQMTWMIPWINNFTTSQGKHIIRDYEDMKCRTGRMVNESIHILDNVKMKCFPRNLTTWQKVGIGIASVVMIAAICVSVLITKRSREVKFLMNYYLKLDTVPKDDKDENVDKMKYDAFFSYS